MVRYLQFRLKLNFISIMKTFSIPTLTAICLLIMTICTSVAVAQTEINTIEDLNNIRDNLDGNYVLTKDLDFAQGSSYATGVVNKAYRPLDNAAPTANGAVVVDAADGQNPGFVPIGDNSSNSAATRFTGTFNGNGFTISNLYVNIASSGYFARAGLFGTIGERGKVLNIGAINTYAKAEGTGADLVRGERVLSSGGLVGYNSGTISNCYATGRASGTGFGQLSVGGLVGSGSFSNIINCYATTAVSGTASLTVSKGGLFGGGSSNIINCYATGTVNGNTGAGGLVGSRAAVFVLNSFWDKNTTGQGTSRRSPDDAGLTTTDLQALNAAATATNEAEQWSTLDWDFGANNQYPTLRSYEAAGNTQLKGFIICNQPTNYMPCATDPILQSSTIDFGETTSPTTRPLIIRGRNLVGNIILTTIAPFTFAGNGLVTTLNPPSDGIVNTSISVTLSPKSEYRLHENTITIVGGSLSESVTVTLAGISTPTLADTDGDGLLEINYIEQLSSVRNNLAGHYELVKNLDFGEDNSYASGTVNNAYRPLNNADLAAAGVTEVDPAMGLNTGLTPIGSDGENATPFTGTFEGNGFTISNLYINNVANGINAGLFGIVGEGGNIQNLGLVNAYVTNSYFFARGTSKNMFTGGLVGSNGGSITNCYATGAVTGAGEKYSPYSDKYLGKQSAVNIGGLVGGNQGLISSSYASAVITGTGGNFVYAGGLVGSNGGSITNCYATAIKTEALNGVFSIVSGGLVGSNGGSITNCYAAGAAIITATDPSDQKEHLLNVGGLVGRNSRGTITNCYATATSSGSGTPGGLVGQNDNGIITNCFWDKETTKHTTSPGSPDETGLTTTALQALMAPGTSTIETQQWSTNDWEFGTNSQYPTLRSRESLDQSQAQGFIMCNQPTNYPSCSTTPVLQGSAINFGYSATPITRQILIVGKT